MGDDLTDAVHEFVRRIGVFESAGDGRPVAEIEVHGSDGRTTFALTPRVAGAFAEALRAYHDPLDQGRCERCGGVRLDDNLICAECGQPHGVFGRLLTERAARFDGTR